MSGSFQTFTNAVQAPGIAGDFASANPRATALSSQDYNNTGFVAGPNGLTIGLFAWLDTATYRIASNAGAGVPNGFVHRAAEALITTYLNAYGMTIPAGFMAGNIFIEGDFFVVNNGTTLATPGMKAYANNTTGVATFAATGSPTTGATSTASTIAAETNGATGTIVDNVFTAVSGLSGTFVPGTVLSGTGVASGTVIQSQVTPLLSGEATGGLGRYYVSPREQTVASTSITGTYGILTVGGTVTGTYGVGQTLTSSVSGFQTGSTITALGTGTGGSGTYYTQTQTVGSGIIDTVTNTETAWYCRSFGQPGEVVKISSNSKG
jgi:hypothetical protein